MRASEQKEKRITTVFIKGGSLISVALGLMAILGWIFDIPQLASFDADIIPMALSTAVLFAAYGLLIFFHGRLSSSRLMFRVEVVVSAIGILVALVLFYFSLSGIRWTVEHLGLKMSRSIDGLVVGHMSPVTAFCFLLVGLSFLIVLTKSGPKKLIIVSFISSVLIIIISIIFLLSYIFGTPLLYEGSFIPPALTTSLASLILGLSLLIMSGLKIWSHKELPDALSTRYTYVLALVFIIIFVSTMTAGYSYYKSYEKQFRLEIENQLSSIATLKVNQIVQWRNERLGDAKVFYNNVEFSKLVQQFITNQNDLGTKKRIQAWIDQVRSGYQYNRICLHTSKGVEIISSPSGEVHNPFNFSLSSSAKLKDGQLLFQDFYFDADDNTIYLTIFIPIISVQSGKNVIGFLALRIDPDQYLYPLINEWPTPSKTAETLLLRREGNEVVFLNELKFQKNAALNFRRPLTELTLPAAQAALGKKQVMVGVDYRGVSVIAYVCPIPNSPWFLVARMDQSEVYAHLREIFWGIIILIVGLLIGSGAGVGSIWRQQRSKFYIERFQSTESIRKLNRVYAVLSGINEAIVRIRKPQELFEKACEIAIEKGGFRMAWIGKFNSQTKKVDLVAYKGVSDEYIKKIDFNFEGDESLLGIAGRVFKTGVHVISNDIQNDGSILPLHKESVMYGSKSFAAFPLKVFGQVWGVFKLYSSEIGFFDEEELKLLDELAMDISFSIEFDSQDAERKHAEELLSNSEIRYRRLFESAKDGILILDAETGKIIDVNPYLIEMLGYSKEKFIEKEIWEIGFFKDIVANYDKFVELQQKKYVRYDNLPLEANDGHKINVEFVSNVYLVDDQNVIQCNIRDITERKRAEESLREKEYMLSQSQNIAHIGSWGWNLKDPIEWSDEMYRIYGVSPETFIPTTESLVNLIYPEDRPLMQRWLADSIEGKSPTSLEFRVILPDGSVHLIKGTGDLIYDSDGKPLYMAGTVQDITERKHAEESLRESEERFRHSFDYAATGVCIVGVDQKFQRVNHAFREMIGYEEDELKNYTFADITHPDDLSIGVAQKKAMLDGEIDSMSFEKRYIRKDKGIIWAYVSASLIRDVNHKPQFFITQIIDITERMQSEEELRKLSRAVEQSPVSITITDHDGNIEYVNPKFTEVTGYFLDEVKGKNLRILNSGYHQREFYEKLWDTILSGKDWEGEFYNKKKNGELFWENGIISPIVNENGDITHFIGIEEDITEKKKMIEELITAKDQAEKSNSLKDAFIANISHEIRTPINGILGMTGLIKEIYSPNMTGEEEEYFTAIDRSCDRIIRTTDLILNYSQLETGTFTFIPKQMELSSICMNLVSKYLVSAKSKSLSLLFENKVGRTVITADEYSITQVLSNLIENAIIYTKSGFVTVKLYQNPQNEILVDVIDSGIGIGGEYLGHIFESYRQEQMGYSRSYEGLGLGLALVKKILDLHNATISVESKKGEGTTFTINFGKSLHNVEELTAKQGIVTKVEVTSTKIDRLVLIVEDDVINQSIIEKYINKKYNTLVADSYDSVMEILDNSKVDLILMDISLQGSKNGLEITKELKASKAYKHIPIIAATAHAL
ncbi:MAG: PAS domain S-box protein, partial [Ignavibacteria bacterium]|nr:PAS domain S-box protein [Ignavibacteria bacterium]